MDSTESSPLPHDEEEPTKGRPEPPSPDEPELSAASSGRAPPGEEPVHLEARRFRLFQCYLNHLLHSRVPPPPDLARIGRQFIEEHNDYIIEVCKGYPKQGREPEDLAQEIWKRLLVRLRDFVYDEQYTSMRAWIEGFARTELRSWPIGAREPILEGSGSDIFLALFLSAAPSPAEVYEKSRGRRIVGEVLDSLPAIVPESSWRVFHSRVFENMTYAAIGEMLDLTPHQARNRFHWVLKQFRSAVEHHPGMEGG